MQQRTEGKKNEKGGNTTLSCEVEVGAHSQACNLCLLSVWCLFIFFFPEHVNLNEMELEKISQSGLVNGTWTLICHLCQRTGIF